MAKESNIELRRGRFGPGLLVAAAFVGPGTVTTASRAGAEFGFALLWAVALSILATMVLQEMSARLGAAGRSGLGQALRAALRAPWLRLPVLTLVVLGIAGGNAAFEMGNILGAASALGALTSAPVWLWSFVIGVLTFALLWRGNYAVIERVLISLVALMSLLFLCAAVAVRPSFADLAGGLFKPALPDASVITVLALIGTTVVPYNLFLHASAAQKRWPQNVPVKTALREARRDSVFSVALGGLLTVAILSTAAAAFFERGLELQNVADMAAQLQPVAGAHARWLFAAGLFAAGLTSAMTAPLAAAYATAGTLDWRGGEKSARFRAVWISIVLLGTVLAVFEQRPAAAIVLAQALNACLLPLLAGCLLYVMNQKSLLGGAVNGALSNGLGAFVLLTVLGLGAFQLLRVLGMVG